MKSPSIIVLVFMLVVVSSCGNNNHQADAELKNPSVIHPPSEAITDSTRLVNDSVIVPDVTTGNETQTDSD
ncbi:MAG TPA: hypothetical protein VGN63_18395 [Flavisolibacter sp.]|jgi:hypothetical protein|nr:hypothetical protein [Flavisolibacter sp.]